MDAVEFVKEMARMCAKYPCCVGCPVEAENDDENCMAKVPAEQMVTIIEQWAKEHPVKTRQSVFLEQWPNVAVSEGGVIKIRPCNLDVNAKKECLGVTCDYCRRDFWMKEVE